MPLYDYACTDASCAATVEASRSIAGRREGPRCPRCGGATELLTSAPLLVFRGTGWSSPTTADHLRARSAAHAARGHALPPRSRPIGPHGRVTTADTTAEATRR